MGWPDIRKINSDFMHEPLNFNNYINDISTFGKYSYALDAENENLWLSLISQSLTLFGHDAIHDTVYERFTDDEVDYMITKNARLGQSFNSFYSIDDFASGPVDTVLKSITIAAYNKLDIKFQNGINRYISANTSENAGTWLTSVFDIDMSSYQTMDDLLADTAFWNSTVASNESLRFVISLSVSSAECMASHTDSSIYVSFIETVAQSTDATMTLINALAATAQLETFFANESVCTAIANSAPSMTAICYNTDGFAAMIASETAMNIVAASETAVNVIVEGIANAANSESVLDGIKGNLTSIEESLPSIANTETVIAEVADVKGNITNVVTSLQSVTSQTDVLIANIDALLASETAMNAIALSEVAVISIFENELVYSAVLSNEVSANAIASSEMAMEYIASNETRMNIAFSFEIMISKILSSSIGREALYRNAEITTNIIKSSSAVMTAIRSSSMYVKTSHNIPSTKSTLYGGKAFVISITGYFSDSRYGLYHGDYITGTAERFNTFSPNTINIFSFASKITGHFWYDTSNSTISQTYEYFKI